MIEPPVLVAVEPRLADGIVIALPFPMARRVDDGSLAFWHAPRRLTFWIDMGKRSHSGDPVEEWRQARAGEALEEIVECDVRTSGTSARPRRLPPR